MAQDDFLDSKLNDRKADGSFRKLAVREGFIDLCSNDYLGIVRNHLLPHNTTLASGSTGSRLLSGNYQLVEETETLIAQFHEAEAALIFNSGYDANLGLLSSVPQKGDTIIFDQLSHASIRDGIRLSFAQAWAFAHNDLDDLRKKLKKASGNIFVVTESIFSMDGDAAPLAEIANLCDQHSAHLIVDEAHATGVVGEKGAGLVQKENLQDRCFARIHTFGKAVGCHGAAIVGSSKLRDYLINFARAFIYTTALPASSVELIRQSYQLLPTLNEDREKLGALIKTFKNLRLNAATIESTSPIQAIIIPGNEKVKAIADDLQKAKLDVRPILSPTVAKGSERLRVVLHSFNTDVELGMLQEILAQKC